MAEFGKASAVDSQTENASVGDKHKTETENPDAKRAKTEKQMTLDEISEHKKKEEEGDVKDQEESPAKPSAVRPGEETDFPSNILEKRHHVKLGKGPIGDAGNTRLVALPKKALPLSGNDRFMAFVERSGALYDEIKGQFLARKEYETKTAGTRHTPAATPIGEGIYAITTTGRESHLVYIITLPEKLDEVQELGLGEKGSFILSTKNPKYPGPAYASLPQGPDYPEE